MKNAPIHVVLIFLGTLLSYGQPRAGISRLWQVSQFHHVFT